MKIFDKATLCFTKNLPFVIYKKPNELQISGFFQNTDEVFYTDDYIEEGFVFAPFDDKEKTIFIAKDKSVFLREDISFSVDFPKNSLDTSNANSQDFHIDMVNKAVRYIANNQFKKVVLSRKEDVKVTNFDSIEIFKRLADKYPTAMTYIWFHPKIGLWLGATPETLLKAKGNEFETMSLAGTQVYQGTSNVQWQQKEIEEQKVVTDYILNSLKPICNNINASTVKTVKAGNLLHLQTKIRGIVQNNKSTLISCLHPTPAVCGFPKKESKEFINNNENYDRSFYTGFLGEINKQGLELFVNLRCMQIKNDIASIYIGGGITKDSNSHKEWEETVAKAKTMKSVLS